MREMILVKQLCGCLVVRRERRGIEEVEAISMCITANPSGLWRLPTTTRGAFTAIFKGVGVGFEAIAEGHNIRRMVCRFGLRLIAYCRN